MAKRITIYFAVDKLFNRFARACKKDERNWSNGAIQGITEWCDKVLNDKAEIEHRKFLLEWAIVNVKMPMDKRLELHAQHTELGRMLDEAETDR